MLQVKEKHPEHQRALVLVVDDEVSICTSLAGVLKDENFEAITAHDGEDALNKVRRFKPELVFLDIWMPGMDGMETLERIKQTSPLTDVIMISGHATISNALEAMKRGAVDFIEKPFTIESVILSATRALSRREQAARELNEAPQKQASAAVTERLFAHRGMSSRALAGANRGQRTLRESVILYGQCLHSGMKSGLVLEPLPANSGLHFSQIGSSRPIPIHIDYVESTEFATTVRSGTTEAATIEHLMAALHAYGVSNLLIKCNGEVPIFDGSAQQFCSVIESVGIEEQGGDWYEIAVDRPISITSANGKESITIEPAPVFSVSYELDYPPPVGRQFHDFTMESVEDFRREISSARTFGFMKDVEKLQKAGLAAGGRLDNFILIGSDRVINTELRYPDELVRHKILDVIGDLFLIGRPLRAKVTARMTGHSDNVELLRKVNALLD